MPMNAVDQMLSDAADVVDERLASDPAAHAETEALLNGGSQPSVIRELNACPGTRVTITIERVAP